MRSIYFLFSRFYVLITFVLFEIFSLSLVFKSHKYQEVRFLNTTNVITANFIGVINEFNTFIHLGTNNKALVEENLRLKRQILYQQSHPIDSNLIKSSDVYTFDYIVANIENNSINKNINYVTLNRGSKHGVQKGLGVISSNGIVGIITNVSESYSLAMSVISVKSQIGVRHFHSNSLGNLTWNGIDPYTLQVNGISKTLPVKKNDTIITAGFSSIFPPNVPVAVIKNFEPDPGSSFYNINVKLTNDVAGLSYVYIVKNNKKNQLDSLMKSIQDVQ